MGHCQAVFAQRWLVVLAAMVSEREPVLLADYSGDTAVDVANLRDTDRLTRCSETATGPEAS